MVARWRRSAAPSPLRSLQRHARCRVWASIRPDRQGRPGLCPSGMIPQCLDGPYLLHYQLLPEKRLAVLMADLFDVKLVTATIARISQNCARRFQSFADALRDHVAAAP